MTYTEQCPVCEKIFDGIAGLHTVNDEDALCCSEECAEKRAVHVQQLQMPTKFYAVKIADASTSKSYSYA